jgi:hypothetical protein
VVRGPGSTQRPCRVVLVSGSGSLFYSFILLAYLGVGRRDVGGPFGLCWEGSSTRSCTTEGVWGAMWQKLLSLAVWLWSW